MPVTQSQIDALNDAIASGVLVVRTGDRTLQYNSLDALRRARDDMKRELAAASTAAPSKLIQLHHGGRGY